MDDSAALAGFLAHQRDRAFSESTIRRRQTAVRSFLTALEPQTVCDATVEDVEVWLRRHPSPQTRYSYRSDLKLFYRWAMRRKLVGTNPVADTDPPRLPKRLPRPVRLDDVGLALTVADGEVQLMILLGALAGLRVSEIAALDASEVQCERTPPILIVRQGKGAKDRVVPLHPVLRDRLAHLPPGFVFANRQGGHVQAQTVSRRIAEAFCRVGIETTAHCLRHSFGTELAREAGGDLLSVASVMGHASTATTMGYVAWSPDAAGAVSRIASPVSAPSAASSDRPLPRPSRRLARRHR